ncbi:MAG TPA: hypothetical protein VMJ75_20235, partial [Candidatus Acidoferrales bacterium]|nr:hypothetical protein [Candidatus Acidoferrales bacterium]
RKPLLRRPYVLLAALMLVAIAVVTAFIISRSRNVPAERALGTARVRAPRADLLEAPRAGAKRVTAFEQGTPVNVVAKLTNPDQRFIRVQFVSPKKNSPAGYVRTADLGDWSSDDPRIAWQFLAVDRPAAGAGEQQRREFIDKLRALAAHFPGTPEACRAEGERASLLMDLVEERKKGGAPPGETDDDLTRAKEALATQGCPVDPAVLTRAEELGKGPPSISPPPPPPTDPALNALVKKAYAFYGNGEYEELAKVVDQMEPLDHKVAARWRAVCDKVFGLVNPKKQ